MTVSRAFKKGTHARLRRTSRNGRVRGNAGLSRIARPQDAIVPEPVWRPIRRGPKPEEPDAPVIGSGPLYETETILVTNPIGVQETQEVTFNRRPTVVDGWMHDDERFFERRHIRVIENARDLWRDLSSLASDPMHGGFDTRGLEIARDGEEAARATNLLRRVRSVVPRWQWNMFENVIRWNEPYGFPGSHLFGDKPRRRDWAMLVVRDAAERISRSLFL